MPDKTNYTAIAEALSMALEKLRELQRAIEAIPYPKMDPFKEKEKPLYQSDIRRNIARSYCGNAVDYLRLAQLTLQDAIAADTTIVDAPQTIHQIN